MKLFHAWQSAQATLLKKRESETKMKATGKTEKLPDLEREIKDVSTVFLRKKFSFFYSTVGRQSGQRSEGIRRHF